MTSATMQVMLSGPPPLMASSTSCSAALSGSRTEAERLVQRLLGHHAGQAVGAEQVAVAGEGLERYQVRLGDRPAVEGAEQQRPVRVRGHVVLGDLALVDQRLDERVVVGDLEELAVAER